jgi:hypothetical protein
MQRLDEADARDLHQILERLAAAVVAARELARERQEPAQQRLSSLRVACPAQPAKQHWRRP